MANMESAIAEADRDFLRLVRRQIGQTIGVDVFLNRIWKLREFRNTENGTLDRLAPATQQNGDEWCTDWVEQYARNDIAAVGLKEDLDIVCWVLHGLCDENDNDRLAIIGEELATMLLPCLRMHRMNCLRNMTYDGMSPRCGMHWISKHRHHASHDIHNERLQYGGRCTMNRRYVRLVNEILVRDLRIEPYALRQLQELIVPMRTNFHEVRTPISPTDVALDVRTMLVRARIRVAMNISEIVEIYKSSEFRFVFVRGLILPARSDDGNFSDDQKLNLYKAAACCLELVERIHIRMNEPNNDVTEENIIARFKPQSITNIIQFALPVIRASYHNEQWRPSQRIAALYTMGIRALPLLRDYETTAAALAAVVENNPRVMGPPVADLQHDHVAGPGERTCVICLTRAAICIAVPSRQLAYCVECARALLQSDQRPVLCSVSKTPLTSIHRVFFPS